jgi:hypothetical protein
VPSHVSCPHLTGAHNLTELQVATCTSYYMGVHPINRSCPVPFCCQGSRINKSTVLSSCDMRERRKGTAHHPSTVQVHPSEEHDYLCSLLQEEKGMKFGAIDIDMQHRRVWPILTPKGMRAGVARSALPGMLGGCQATYPGPHVAHQRLDTLYCTLCFHLS